MNDRRSRLAGTFQRFAEEARNRALAIRDQVTADLPQGTASVQTILLHAHTLAGTSETMCAREMGETAGAIEALVKALPDGGRPDASGMERLDTLSLTLWQQAQAFDPVTSLDAFLEQMAFGA